MFRDNIVCGIVGGWYRDAREDGGLARVAEDMLTRLVHRGPDDGGYTVGSRGFLGNRRLKIFDLSSAGNQPFFNDNGRSSAVISSMTGGFLPI